MKRTTVCLMFTIEREREREREVGDDGLLTVTWAALVCLVLLVPALPYDGL